jgi:3-hydroxybutyryl-CoA dehydrogenase
METRFKTVGVAGSGAMGRGIAQIAAQAGSVVRLYDTQPAAVERAIQELGAQWDRLQEKGRMDAGAVQAAKERLRSAASLGELADCDLVIEAVVERLDVKQSLFAELETIVGADAVLASNTSSLSVTAIAAKLQRPQRLAGYHFFNPVPLMKVVEVIAGIKTDPAVCEGLTGLRAADGAHAGAGAGTRPASSSTTPAAATTPRRCASRPKAWRLRHHRPHPARPGGLQARPLRADGPHGLDVSHPVMESVYRQYYDEPRYRPSVITAQRLAGNVLGARPAQASTATSEGKAQVPAEPPAPEGGRACRRCGFSTRAARRAELLQLLKDLGAKVETGQSPSRRR